MKRAFQIIALLFFVIGSIVFYVGVDLIKDSIAFQKWPTTTAVVVNAKYERMEGLLTSFLPYVFYQYKVAGQLYTSDRIFLEQGDSIYVKKIEKLLEKYPIGKEVSVFYNPENPSIAMLELGIKPFYIIISVIGLIFISGSVFIFFAIPRLFK